MNAKKIQSRHGIEVTVEHSVSVTRGYFHVLAITARCGKVVERRTCKIGGSDGQRNLITSDGIQKVLDEQRQMAADEAAWKESVRTAILSVE